MLWGARDKLGGVLCVPQRGLVPFLGTPQTPHGCQETLPHPQLPTADPGAQEKPWAGSWDGFCAHLDGVSLPHLPEVVEPRFLQDGEGDTEREESEGSGGPGERGEGAAILTSTMTAMPAMKAIR